ncbi:MAG: RsmB/NOP family class I SAM-dependent RNA methyltransferase [Opitutaceae bacterium]|nr:RsmB/NOP family class I SAM-dependent RNA methyltransferase [Opitutaceae bacterium]
MKSLPNEPAAGAWPVTVALLERWLGRGTRVDALLEEAGRKGPGALSGEERARCQHLLFGTLRNLDRLNAVLRTLMARTPRARLRAALLVAGFELFEAATMPDGEGPAARIVHHAVGQAKRLLSPAEVRFVNAVLRKLAVAPGLHCPAPDAAAGAAEQALFFSHPEWLVRRWQAQFGAKATRSLLQWNQTPPPVYGRWRGPAKPPGWLQATPWAGFFVVPAGHWPEVERLLTDGALYLQDPATLMAVELLDPQPGETVLDLCAAPGGKSLLLADLLEARTRQGGAGVPAGRVVAVDLPDNRRLGRLKENLAKVRTTAIALVQADILKLSPRLLREHGLPVEYTAVLLDAPCSNTGVMRHRVDVKWRLQEGDIAKHAGQQLALLTAAARFVAPGGRLVYSTCSLEAEENEGVVGAFRQASGNRFRLEQTRHGRPWEAGCDGAGVFLLRKKPVACLENGRP